MSKVDKAQPIVRNEELDAALYKGLNGGTEIEMSTDEWKRVSEFPLTGKKIETSQKTLFGLRAIPVNDFPKYLIYCTISGKSVYVLRVLHGARDLRRLIGVEQER